ncbi:caspase-9 [Caerostris extrusa]|uniref:Caspase-9 n=1 Tax=Caerostris extrusa TaxID=172846 RepID=A0AAV4WHI5_CAEEX|nr:caspase-9 [Caerostris extrusa]
MLNDIYDLNTDCDFFGELTSRGPDAHSKFGQVLKEAGYSEEAEILLLGAITSCSKQLCYKMYSKPLGFCLIINNVEFDNLEDRIGSDVDAEALEYLFRKIGYIVECERNMTADNMLARLIKFRDENEWASVDSCVLIILSYGDNVNNLDIIYGTDSLWITKTEIYRIFANINCEDLQYKPKMFFFKACRVDGGGHEVYVTESTDAVKKVVCPSLSNLLVVHSSFPDHVPHRNELCGTWFCHDLVQVLNSNFLTQDLETMLKTVTQKLKNRLSRKQRKQVLHIV